MKSLLDSNYHHRKTDNTRLGTMNHAWFLQVASKIDKSITFPLDEREKGTLKVNDVRNKNKDITTERGGGSSRKHKSLLCRHLKILVEIIIF